MVTWQGTITANSSSNNDNKALSEIWVVIDELRHSNQSFYSNILTIQEGRCDDNPPGDDEVMDL